MGLRERINAACLITYEFVRFWPLAWFQLGPDTSEGRQAAAGSGITVERDLNHNFEDLQKERRRSFNHNLGTIWWPGKCQSLRFPENGSFPAMVRTRSRGPRRRDPR